MNWTEDKINKNRVIALLIPAIFFVLPFERIPTVEVGNFTIKISYIISLIFLIAALCLNPCQLFKRLKVTWSDKFLLLFWISGLTSILFNTTESKRSLTILLMWLFVFILYLILSRVISTEKIRKKSEDMILLSSLVVCLFGLFQFVGDSLGLSTKYTGLATQYTKVIFDFPRIQSVALEPLYFANFLLVPLFISIRRFIQNSSWRYSLLSILILLNIILTVSRGAYAGLAVSVIIFAGYLLVIRRVTDHAKKIKGIALIFLASIVVAAAMIWGLNGRNAGYNFVAHTVVTVQDKNADFSKADRINTSNLAVDLFKERPALGIGLGNYGVQVTPKEKQERGIYQTVNNIYLEILSENGLMGLCLFLLFLIFYFIEVFKGFHSREELEKLSIVCLSLGLLAVFIQYNFFSTLYIIYIWTFLALLKSYSYSNEER